LFNRLFGYMQSRIYVRNASYSYMVVAAPLFHYSAHAAGLTHVADKMLTKIRCDFPRPVLFWRWPPTNCSTGLHI